MKDHVREYAEKKLKPQDDDLAPPIARWSDGSQHQVAELTSLAARTMNDAPVPTQRASTVYYEARTNSGAPVVVKDRADRGLLVSMYLSGKQVLQVLVLEGAKRSRRSRSS